MVEIYTDYEIVFEIYQIRKIEELITIVNGEKFWSLKDIRKSNKLKAIKYKGGICVDCGEARPIAMDFHHTKDKKYNINKILTKPWPIIQAELDKCELLCVICHRIRHHG